MDADMEPLDADKRSAHKPPKAAAAGAALARPAIKRAQSKKSAVSTPSAAAAAAIDDSAAASSSAPSLIPPPPPSRFLWSVEEHDEFVASVWRFGVQSTAVVGASPPRHRLLPAAASITVVPAKSASQCAAYLRLFLWDLYASFAFSAPLLRGCASHNLNAAFLESLLRLHPDDINGERGEEDVELARSVLALPRESNVQSAAAHAVLLAWISRLRRSFVLRELLADRAFPKMLSDELALDYSDASVLPEANWTVAKDAEILRSAASAGYGARSAHTPAAALLVERLDFVLDTFQSQCLMPQPESTPDAPLPSASVASAVPAVPSASPFSAPSHSAPVWTAALIHRVVSVLRTQGVPMRSLTEAAHEQKEADASAPINWPALYSLLSQRTGQAFDARWQLSLLALFQHSAAEYESSALRSLISAKSAFLLASAQPFPALRIASSTQSLLSPQFSLSFRRSLLFFHQLRLRILDLGFHQFRSQLELLEWVSQYAPSIVPPVDQPDSSDNHALLTGDLFTGSLSLHAASASPMPSWWQIGFHDYCLLRYVGRAGLPEDARWFEELNREVARTSADEARMDESESSAAAEAILWTSAHAWKASFVIISARMNIDPATAAKSVMPAVSSIESHQRAAVLRRIAQVVPLLSSTSTDELINRLLAAVEPRAHADSMETADATVSSPLPFCLSVASAAELRFFERSLIGFSFQAELFELLQTRYHELVPTGRRTASYQTSLLSHSAAKATDGAEADSAHRDNPLKLSDDVYLRPSPTSVSSTSLLRDFAASAFTSVDASSSASDASPSDEAADASADASELARKFHVRRRNAELKQRMAELCQDANERPTAPSRICMSEDGRIVLPQQLADGFVLHSLGSLSSNSITHARLLSTARVKLEAAAASAASSSPAASLALFPIGYTAVVAHQSYTRPDALVSYLCQILPGARESELQFQVTASDDLDHPLVAASAQAVWEEIAARIAALDGDVSSQRLRNAVDGLERFGLTLPTVQSALLVEVRADATAAGQLSRMFTTQQLQAHVHALPHTQFYLLPPAAPSAPTAIAPNLTRDWRLHECRYLAVARSLQPEAHLTVTVNAVASSIESEYALLRQRQAAEDLALEQNLRLSQQQQAAAAQQQAQQQAAQAAAAHAAAMSSAAAMAAAPPAYYSQPHYPMTVSAAYATAAHQPTTFHAMNTLHQQQQQQQHEQHQHHLFLAQQMFAMQQSQQLMQQQQQQQQQAAYMAQQQQHQHLQPAAIAAAAMNAQAH